jgi:hypothetical protein
MFLSANQIREDLENRSSAESSGVEGLCLHVSIAILQRIGNQTFLLLFLSCLLFARRGFFFLRIFNSIKL